jgi:hypothetical protein
MKLSERIRAWYEAGRGGLTTLGRRHGMSEDVIAGIEHWFEGGEIRLGPIIKDLEALENTQAAAGGGRAFDEWWSEEGDNGDYVNQSQAWHAARREWKEAYPLLDDEAEA